VKILVVGGGGREHALVWKIAQSGRAPEILCAPGNAGIAEIARTVPVPADDIDGLVALASEEECDLTVVGPELPLTMGLVDRLSERGLAAFGPTAAAARIEGSKWFAKELMLRASVPTARAWLTASRDEAVGRARELGCPVVVKADGLAAGKGVVVAENEREAVRAIDDALVRARFGASGERVVIEECLVGEEASILAFTDGTSFALLPPSQDYKRALDGDAGPNTGGMGAYAPVPAVTDAVRERIEAEVIGPTIEALSREHGVAYRGVLYAGLMLTSEGPKVIEFNCRFGDPEAQVTLPLMDGDIVDVMLAVVEGRLDPSSVRSRGGSAACVVMASGGYPDAYEKGKPVTGLKDAAGIDGVVLFHAGTAGEGGAVVTSGGRVLGVTGIGTDLTDALRRAYDGVRAVVFEGASYRSDIGYRALERASQQGRRA